MLHPRHFLIPFAILYICSLSLPAATSDVASKLSIYDVLKVHGLPMGLLPKGVKNFTVDNSGQFQVYLDRACNAKFENQIHYDMNVSGILRFGQINELSGISAQDLFLWFPVIEIRVDIPSSGLIYFNVGVVSKQFSLSSFETPRDCLDGPRPDLQGGREIVETVSKISAESVLAIVFLCSVACLLLFTVLSHTIPVLLHDTMNTKSSGRHSTGVSVNCEDAQVVLGITEMTTGSIAFDEVQVRESNR